MARIVINIPGCLVQVASTPYELTAGRRLGIECRVLGVHVRGILL